MIADRAENASRYYGLGGRLQEALRSLSSDLTGREPGRYELQGDELYALVQEYETRPREACAWEAHRRYADVQFIVSGRERFGVAPADTLGASRPYDPEKDVAFYEGEGDFVTLEAGCFIVFFPGEAHMPLVQVDGPERVKKLVLKVLAG